MGIVNMDILELLTDLESINNLNKFTRFLNNKTDEIFLECNSIDDFKGLLKKIEEKERHVTKVLAENRKPVHDLLFMTLGYIRCRALGEIEKKIKIMPWNEKAIYFIEERKLLNLNMSACEFLKEIDKSEQELISRLESMKCSSNKLNWENTRKLLLEYDLLLSSAGLKAGAIKIKELI